MAQEVKERPLQSLPLWKTRTQTVYGAIAREFAWQKEPQAQNYYLFTGGTDYRIGKVQALQLVREKVAQEKDSKRTIKVLDIGTADGRFVAAAEEAFPGKVDAMGITAAKFPAQTVSSEKIRVTNAETLLEDKVVVPGQFDVIVSAVTFLHFKDPFGTLSELYSLLRPGGILAIDEFAPNGVEQQLPGIINQLQAAGYPVTADFEYAIMQDAIVPVKIRSLMISKPAQGHAELLLPVSYPSTNSSEAVQYTSPAASTHIPLPNALGQFLHNMEQLGMDFSDPDQHGQRKEVLLNLEMNRIGDDIPTHLMKAIDRFLVDQLEMAGEKKAFKRIPLLQDQRILLSAVIQELIDLHVVAPSPVPAHFLPNTHRL